MATNWAKSANAAAARALMRGLQSHFVGELQRIGGEQRPFDRLEWCRDEGRHGGGSRYVAAETPVFNRAAVNVSGVHYDDDPSKKLRSADALSTIIHPRLPYAPSVHLHFSWTEMRDGNGYYRLMADLNPSVVNDGHAESFASALRAAAGEHYGRGATQGDTYFHIPALARHRGVTHFYLEGFNSGDFRADTDFAERVARAAIAAYCAILQQSLAEAREVSDAAARLQLDYHTVYLFQVLTLDRGTTSGLLVHDQNDLGVMGSLPSYVDATLLLSWADRMPSLQRPLLVALAETLGSGVVRVDDAMRLRLAQVVRRHYQENPEALKLQASGDVLPHTGANHS